MILITPTPTLPTWLRPSSIPHQSRYATTYLQHDLLWFSRKVRRVLARVFTPPLYLCLPLLALLLVVCLLLVTSFDLWLQSLWYSLDDVGVFFSFTFGALVGISCVCWGCWFAMVSERCPGNRGGRSCYGFFFFPFRFFLLLCAPKSVLVCFAGFISMLCAYLVIALFLCKFAVLAMNLFCRKKKINLYSGGIHFPSLEVTHQNQVSYNKVDCFEFSMWLWHYTKKGAFVTSFGDMIL